MERLVTTSDAAKLLNLSIQGIHYRIKKGQLRSKKENGRVFVYIDEKNISAISQKNHNENSVDHYQTIINLKNEQIVQIKSTLDMVIKQYKKEIKRLDKNQEKMIEVFKSEIKLLQQAFNEMRSIYQIEHKKDKSKIEFISVNDFFILMKKYGKTDIQIKDLILNRIKLGDKRFIFNKDIKELLIYKSDYMDLI